MACSSRGPVAPPPSSVEDRLDAIAMFHTDRVITAGLPQRLPFALWGTPGLVRDGEILGVEVAFEGELIATTEVAGEVIPHDHVGDATAHQHSDQQRYYPLRLTLPRPGIYDVTIVAADQRIAFPVQAFAPDDVGVIRAGQPFPGIETPTLTAGRGVDPICTLHDGPCPLHSTSAAEFVNGGRAFVVLVGSPAYCTNAFCASTLRLLIDRAARNPDLGFVHAEPYAAPRNAGAEDPVNSERAPIMAALGLSFEPALFLVDATGLVVDRLDAVVSETELDRALGDLTG